MSVDPNSTHYDAGGIETIEIIKAKLTPEQFEGFCMGNALKYLSRANYKHDTTFRDCEKARIYMAMLTRWQENEDINEGVIVTAEQYADIEAG